MVMHVYKRDGRKEPSKSFFSLSLGGADSAVAFDKVCSPDLFSRILADMISFTDHGTSKLLSSRPEAES